MARRVHTEQVFDNDIYGGGHHGEEDAPTYNLDDLSDGDDGNALYSGGDGDDDDYAVANMHADDGDDDDYGNEDNRGGNN